MLVVVVLVMVVMIIMMMVMVVMIIFSNTEVPATRLWRQYLEDMDTRQRVVGEV